MRLADPTLRRAADGFTLLEVILALAILGGALAVIGEIVQLADRNAADAQLQAQAQMLAESVVDELLAGVISLENVTRQAVDTQDRTPWVYSVTLGSSDLEGIVPAEVLVEQDLEDRMRPARFRIARWFSNVAAAAGDSTADAAAGDTAGSGTGGGNGPGAP
jgi:prepilin-type N-terminal cleavage/methylation domain-containing protein